MTQASAIRPLPPPAGSPFLTYEPEFAQVLGDAPRLVRVADIDAHEGPVYVPGQDALYFTTLPQPDHRGVPACADQAHRARRDPGRGPGGRERGKRHDPLRRRAPAGLRAGHADDARPDHGPRPRLRRGRDADRKLETAAPQLAERCRRGKATERSGSRIRATGSCRDSGPRPRSVTASTASTHVSGRLCGGAPTRSTSPMAWRSPPTSAPCT